MLTIWRKAAFFLLSFFCLLLTGCETLTGMGGGPRVGVSIGEAEPAPPPQQVALLVPLHGNIAATGQAIRNGFLTAYYQEKEVGEPLPQVDVVDTSEGNIIQLYQQAVAKGATMVVGPLTKENVRRLSEAGNLTVPTIALNTLEDESTKNLYQFGLSPNEEAQQVAVKAKQSGYSRALIIYPSGSWGQGIANAFAQTWQKQGGVVVDSYAFSKQYDMANGIRNLLQVTGLTLKGNVADKDVKPERRQDVDVVFLVAFPQQARQIRPLLSYYYAQDLPVYATSLVYSGSPSPQADQDLDGIIFCDMPWVLEPNKSNVAELRNRIMTLWSSSYQRSPRMYAFGIDAYQLIRYIGQLQNGSSYHGMTGVLYLGSDRHVLRNLDWAKMQNGTPQLISAS